MNDPSSYARNLWSREAPLDGVTQGDRVEHWRYRGGAEETSFKVAVTIGKPLDVVGLKGTTLEETRSYAAHLRKTAAMLYSPGSPRRILYRCPCCDTATGDAAETARIFGVPYNACSQCGHGFVREQPTAAALDALYAGSDEHAQIYVDAENAEFRIANVVEPKLGWLIDAYRNEHGRAPQSVLDVGAGGGHFVAGARRAGFAAAGIETSRASRRFAQEYFDISLSAEDFLDGPAGAPVDVVTMWGLLEYTPEPRRFLAAALKRLDPETGLLVVEVPRLNCLSTAVQRLSPDTVARHLDPTTHVNTFTDASLATALITTGFRPVAAWYFGMDAYELLMQQALRLDNQYAFIELADMIPDLQASLDAGQQCDDIVMAARPID